MLMTCHAIKGAAWRSLCSAAIPIVIEGGTGRAQRLKQSLMLERLIAVDLVDSVQCEIEVSALVLAVGAACKGAPIPNNTMLSTKSTGLRRCTRCRQKCMCFLSVGV